MLYDVAVFALATILMFALYEENNKLSYIGIIQQSILAFVCVFASRLVGNVYGQIWRYGGIQCYIRLLCTDAIAFLVYMGLELLLPIEKITFSMMLCLSCLNCLSTVTSLVHAMHINVVIRRLWLVGFFLGFYIQFLEL